MQDKNRQKIILNNKEFEVIDAWQKMTVPDCWVMKNKIGTAHGEAKFYIGHKGEDLSSFFDNFSRKCFILKQDLQRYLSDVKKEYDNPEQPYKNSETMSSEWEEHISNLTTLDEVEYFKISLQTQIKGPRQYINSNEEIYKFMRQISIPNITYFLTLKLKDSNGEIFYYFKLFVDYFGEEEHPLVIEKEKEKIEEDKTLKGEEKQNVIRARIGQGEYREGLLNECPFCPITMVSDERLLIASHIKPWAKCDSHKERIDPKNGFLLTPTFDKLFDRGFITFDNDGTMKVSPFISPMNQSKLGIKDGKKYPRLPIKGREKYLEYHRSEVYNKI